VEAGARNGRWGERVEGKDVLDPRAFACRSCKLGGVHRRFRGNFVRRQCTCTCAFEKVVERSMQDSLGFFGSSHRERLVGKTADERQRCDASIRLLSNPEWRRSRRRKTQRNTGCRRLAPGLFAQVFPLHHGRDLRRQRRRARRSERDRFGHGDDVFVRRTFEHHLLRTDRDPVAVSDFDSTLDLRLVHAHAVTAAQVFNGHPVRSPGQKRLATRPEDKEKGVGRRDKC